MIGEIVSIGTELLLGQITNTNARFLAQMLAELGIDAYFQQVVGDNRGRLEDAIRLALSRSDLVVTSGGLGPTEDDLTKEVVCEVLGVPLIEDRDLGRSIVQVLDRHGAPVFAAAVSKQSMVPEGATVLPNPVGTAPGLLVEASGRLVALLPGPPAEFESIARLHLLPALRDRLEAGGPVGVQGADGGEGADGGARHGRQYLFTRVVKLCAIGEPAVEDAVRDLIHSSNPTVAPLVAVGETHLRVTAKAADADQARDLVDRTVRVIEERLGEYIFGYDADSLAKAVGALLKAKGLSLAVAESLTGGLVGHLLTDVPGSSDYFDRDVVAYSNRAKTEVLGVSPETIARHGAVSEETAREMATGVRRMSGADVGVALTGIAGPGGGTPEKPVGLVYIAVARSVTGRETSGLDVSCHRVIFSGERWLVKRRAAHRALTLLWRLLQA